MLEDEFDIHRNFWYQILEDKPEEDSIQSFNILGNLWDQFHRSNASISPFKQQLRSQKNTRFQSER